MKVKTRFSKEYKKAFPHNKRKSVSACYHYPDWYIYDVDSDKLGKFKEEFRMISVYDEDAKKYVPKRIPVLEVKPLNPPKAVKKDAK